jgi:tetratricopeptide (TPR) repeat protein
MSTTEVSLRVAEELLERARQLRWDFPSSSGSPVRRGDPRRDDLERLLGERHLIEPAALRLLDEGEAELALELAAHTWRLWVIAGDAFEGLQFLRRLLDRSDSRNRWRVFALYGAGLLAFRLGDAESAGPHNSAALQIARELEDPEALVLAHLAASRDAFEASDYELARAHATTAHELAHAFDPGMQQAPLHMLAQSTRLNGDYAGAAALFAASLELNRQLDDAGMVLVEAHNLGHVALHLGDIAAARACFEEAARLGSTDDEYGQAMSALNEGALAFAEHQLDQARSALDRALAILGAAGIEPAADDRWELEWLQRRLAASHES